MFLHVDISAMYKRNFLISMDYFISQQTFRTIPLSISLGNSLSPTTATFEREYALYYTR